MRLLKQKTSGEIYVWTEQLAKRKDMEEYVRDIVVEEVVVPPEPVQEEKADEDIKQMARAVLTKKPGRKSSGNKIESQ